MILVKGMVFVTLTATWYEMDIPKYPIPNSPIPLPRSRQLSKRSFEPPTPTTISSESTTTTGDDDIPTSVLLRQCLP